MNLQISAESLTVPIPFVQRPGKEDFNLVRFTLAHPGPGVPERVVLRQIPRVNPAVPGDDPFATYLTRPFGGVLFKEDIVGVTYLEVSVLAVDRESKLGALLRKAFVSAASAGLGLAVGGLGNVVLGAFLSSAGQSVLGGAGGDDNADTAIMGRTIFRIDPRALPADGVLPGILVPPQTITKTIYAHPPGPRHQPPVPAGTQIVLQADQPNGEIRLRLTAL